MGALLFSTTHLPHQILYLPTTFSSQVKIFLKMAAFSNSVRNSVCSDKEA